jgi:hypothetical protein
MLVGVDLVSEMVGSVLMTGYLETDQALSLMLIAAPESGKTSVVTDPDMEERVVCSDATGNGICEELAQHPKLHHIIINDMVAVMAHKENTNKRTWAILNGLTDEGLQKISLPGKAGYDFKGRTAGIICCIPLEMVTDGRVWWQRTGFTSRFLPFCYEYSKKLVLRIKKETIVNAAYEHRNHRPKIVFPDKQYNIKIGNEDSTKIQIIADRMAKGLTEKGLRRGKQLRSLIRGHALWRNRKKPEIRPEDFHFLNEILPFVSYDVPQEL